MTYFFNSNINNETDWKDLASFPRAFDDLARNLFKKHNITFSDLEFITNASNAVFSSGNYIIKFILAKPEDDYEKESFQTEIFGINTCVSAKIPTVNLIAHGLIKDKYNFYYIIMEKCNAMPFSLLDKTNLSKQRKIKIAQNLSDITDKLNIPCESFNNRNFIEMAIYDDNWKCFSSNFQAERLSFIKNYNTDKSLVFIHADINQKNILINDNDELIIIDFADSLLAPKEYELPVIVFELFNLDKDFLYGFFNQMNINNLAEICAKALIFHYYGAEIIKKHIKEYKELKNIYDLKKTIVNLINNSH